MTIDPDDAPDGYYAAPENLEEMECHGCCFERLICHEEYGTHGICILQDRIGSYRPCNAEVRKDQTEVIFKKKETKEMPSNYQRKYIHPSEALDYLPENIDRIQWADGVWRGHDKDAVYILQWDQASTTWHPCIAPPAEGDPTEYTRPEPEVEVQVGQVWEAKVSGALRIVIRPHTDSPDGEPVVLMRHIIGRNTFNTEIRHLREHYTYTGQRVVVNGSRVEIVRDDDAEGDE